MKNNGLIILIIAIFSVTTILLFYFGNFGTQKKYNWSTTFKHDKDQPYDFSILQQLLKENYEFERIDRNPAEKLPIDDAKNNAYFFIGGYPYHDQKTAEAIFNFAKNGGEVVLLTESIPDSLVYFISGYINNEIFLQTEIRSSLEINASFRSQADSKNYRFSYKTSAKDSSEFYWTYFPSDFNSAFTRYGSFKERANAKKQYVNFVGLEVGNGHIYWHSNPLLFTNLYLSKNNVNGFEHLNAFLGHFEAKKWYWDHASVTPTRSKTPSVRDKAEKPKTSMQYIFSQPALKFAWLILLATTLLYALFGAKRRQQHIPIIEANRNTSLEFINTIGLLYFQQQDHKVIFEKIMQLFKAHLRRRYGLMLKDEDLQEEDKIRLTVKRTDINESIIRNIFSNYLELKSKLNRYHVEMSAETLNNFYQLVDNFYKAEIARKHSAKNAQTTV
jgi:hypothetical protein